MRNTQQYTNKTVKRRKSFWLPGHESFWRLPLLSPPLPSPSFLLEVKVLKVGPLKPTYKEDWKRCKLPSGVWGESPTANDFGAF